MVVISIYVLVDFYDVNKISYIWLFNIKRIIKLELKGIEIEVWMKEIEFWKDNVK